jgi:hypothetical protein
MHLTGADISSRQSGLFFDSPLYCSMGFRKFEGQKLFLATEAKTLQNVLSTMSTPVGLLQFPSRLHLDLIKTSAVSFTAGPCPGLLKCLHFFQQNSLGGVSWSKSQLFFIFHNFMVKINTFFAEWWSGPISANRQGQNTAQVLVSWLSC